MFHEAVPNFTYRISSISEELPPLRAYYHNSGFIAAFTDKVKEIHIATKNHLIDTLKENKGLIESGDYLLAMLWGDDGDKMIDIFKYSGVKNNWKANPGVESLVMKNGIYSPDKEITCGDGMIVLGQEEEYRRTTWNLKDYMEHSPEIRGLSRVGK